VTSIVLAGQSLLSEPWADGADCPLPRIAAGADATITNLEAAIRDPAGWPTKTGTLHPANPAVIGSLKHIGFNLLAHANNHAFDLGPAGIAAARHAAQSAGLLIAGSGADLEEAAAPAVTGERVALIACDLGPQPDIVYAGSGSARRPGINPLHMDMQLAVKQEDYERLRAIADNAGYLERIASRVRAGHRSALPDGALDFFGVTVRPDGAAAEEHIAPRASDLTRLENGIATAKKTASRVVVSLHYHRWEADWAQTPEWLRLLAHRLVDCGADVVFCHGPPVMQGMEFYHGKPLFFGMGNLIFQTRRASRYAEGGFDVWRSVVTRCEFGADALERIVVHPIAVGRPAEDGRAPTPPSVPIDGNATLQAFLARSRLGNAKIAHAGTPMAIEL